MPPPASARTTSALGRRLLTAGRVVLSDDPQGSAALDEVAARGNGALADALFRHVKQTKDDAELWLLLVALTAAFPDSELFLGVRRALGMAPAALVLPAVFEAAQLTFQHFDSLDYDIRIVSDRPVADVDFCAKYDHNTGIQRVVRETMTRWNGVHDLELACWSPGDNALRELTPVERRRVVDWDAWKLGSASAKAAAPGARTAQPTLIVPFRTVLLLPEVARDGYSARLAAAAQYSGNRVGLIGYDTIPVASADQIASMESEKFAKYLSVVKHADRVAAISESAAREFEGFASAASAQGLPPANVVSVPLAVQVPSRGTAASAAPGASASASASASAPAASLAVNQKLVLMVGNQEPRKNNLAVLFAAETLWREGLPFVLRMIGGGNSDYTRELDRQVRRLERLGYPVQVLRGAGDDVLVDSYATAYCTVFPSTHEGFGLPVAESLAQGVPSITSDFGSTAEIAAGGGCLTVDPRSDAALADALRRLLSDDELHARLVAEAAARPVRDWNDYATELWQALVEPLERDRRD